MGWADRAWPVVFGIGLATVLVSPTTEVIVPFTAVLAVLTIRTRPELGILDVPLVILIPVLLGVNVVGSTEDLRRAVYSSAVLVIGWLVRQRIACGKQEEALLPVAVVSGALSSVIVAHRLLDSQTRVEAPVVERVAVFGLNANYHAYWLCLGIGSALLLLDRAPRMWHRVALGLNVALGWLAIEYLGTRAAQIGALLAAGAYALALLLRSSHVRFLALIAPVAWILAAYASYSATLARMGFVEAWFGRHGSPLNGRLEIWASAHEVLASRVGPFGLGLDTYTRSLGDVGAHNIFLAYSLSGGVVVSMLAVTYLIVGFSRPLLLGLRGQAASRCMVLTSAILTLCLLAPAVTGVVEFSLALWIAHGIASARPGTKSEAPHRVFEQVGDDAIGSTVAPGAVPPRGQSTT